jgi:hypothetical protein
MHFPSRRDVLRVGTVAVDSFVAPSIAGASERSRPPLAILGSAGASRSMHGTRCPLRARIRYTYDLVP